MNKKGSITLSLIAGAVIAIILLLIFLIPKFRIFLIGLIFVFAGIFIATKGEGLTRRKSIFALMFIAIGVLIFLFQGFLQQQTYGFTTLSVSNADIVDSGSRIRVFGVANGAEALQINFNPANVNPYIVGEGYEATKSVIGSIGMLNPTRDFYSMKDYNKNFIGVGYYDLSILKSCSNNIPVGLDQSTPVFRVGLTGICVYEKYYGTYAPFTGTTVDNTKVLFQIGTASGTISPSEGQNTLTLNDGKTKVEWVGNLMNYKNLEAPNSWALLWDNNKYTKMIDADAYSRYYTLRETYGLNNGIGVFASKDRTKAIIDGFNNGLIQIIADKSTAYKSTVQIDSFTYTAQGLQVGLVEATAFPTFIMTLDASSLGIIELKGIPDIQTCVPNQDVLSGNQYTSQVSVKNIGANTGNFIGSVSCTGNSGVSGTAGTTQVEKGLTGTIPVYVTGLNSVSGTQDNTCTVKITDQKSGQSDSCKFTLGVTFQKDIKCEMNSKKCVGSAVLRICNADGTSYTDTGCEFGCIVTDSGLSVCKSEDAKCGDGLCNSALGETNMTCPADCNDFVACSDRTPAFLGWEETTTTKQTIWSRIGIGKPRTETYCKATNAPYVFGGVLALILGLSALFIIPKKRVKGKSTKYGKVGK